MSPVLLSVGARVISVVSAAAARQIPPFAPSPQSHSAFTFALLPFTPLPSLFAPPPPPSSSAESPLLPVAAGVVAASVSALAL